MKKIIPMQKEITFRTMIGEMIELSLENNLSLVSEYSIEGNLIMYGRYKMTEATTIEEEFQESVPVTIDLDDKYDTSSVEIDMSDFYYEIINDNVLRVHVEFIVDGLEEKIVDVLPELDDGSIHIEASSTNRSEKSDSLLSLQDIPEVKGKDAEEIPVEVYTPSVMVSKDEPFSPMNSIFTSLHDADETFSTYHVYVVREYDTIEKITENYHVTKEELANYNKLEEMTVGTKLIIPCGTVNESH